MLSHSGDCKTSGGAKKIFGENHSGLDSRGTGQVEKGFLRGLYAGAPTRRDLVLRCHRSARRAHHGQCLHGSCKLRSDSPLCDDRRVERSATQCHGSFKPYDYGGSPTISLQGIDYGILFSFERGRTTDLHGLTWRQAAPQREVVL
jgi:hypothetical protein